VPVVEKRSREPLHFIKKIHGHPHPFSLIYTLQVLDVIGCRVAPRPQRDRIEGLQELVTTNGVAFGSAFEIEEQ
jgi:hypothetical protein